MDITTKEIEQLEYALFEEEVRLKREHIELKKELKLLSEKLPQTLLSSHKFNIMMQMENIEKKIKNDLIMLARKKDEIERKKSYQRILDYKRQEQLYKAKEALAKIKSEINQKKSHPSYSINSRVVVHSKISKYEELYSEIKNNLSSLSIDQKLELAELLLENL
ncbi:hypothetical protein VKI21_04385 [Cyanobacterium aponinum UTEX 3222]|uniref:Uncharacterized protein n=1 Tax=Cyanobacterium aponinum AL20115 TaxID=3090662 RepID=A0AAF1C134_9CHRO|nr:hypothetical protein [Cyanobacterium aponinum]WPF88222.1 hypothetical protein SAY89_15700 [Cyanobacterium aponinum AL20115]WRL42929.1 hypothetical protein VKI21_04385 [Cyanobacterium aponinum UTEX 3222]